MNGSTRKIILGAAGGLALLASGNAPAMPGIQIDPTGGGLIGGSNFISGLVPFDTGHVLFDSCFEVTPANSSAALPRFCTMTGQSKLDDTEVENMGFDPASDGTTIHYAFSIPIQIWAVDGGALGTGYNIEQRTGQKGTFQMFLDLDGDSAMFTESADNAGDSGTGFSNLNGDMTTSLLLLEGHIVLGPNSATAGTSGKFTLTDDGTTSTQCDEALGDDVGGACAGDTAGTRTVANATASYNALVDITYQDDNYVVNDMVNTGFAIQGIAGDITNFSASLDATSNIALVEHVGGLTANYAGPGGTADNNFACPSAVGPLTTSCDLQRFTKGSFEFMGARIPEPGTVALLGGGLALFGVARRRRQRLNG